MAGIKPGEVNATLQSLRRISMGVLKESAPQGGITLTRNIDSGFIAVNGLIPVEEIETDEGILIKGIDFLETDSSSTV